MTDIVSRWAYDEEGPPLEQWTTNRFYREALRLNIQDPRVIANAAATLELAERFSRQHPNIPFDHICEGILLGLQEYLPKKPKAYFGFITRLRLKRWWTKWSNSVGINKKRQTFS